MYLNLYLRRLVPVWGGLVFALLLAFVLPPAAVYSAAPITGPVVVRPGGATLTAAPDGAVQATLPTSTIVTATARTADQSWLWVTTADGAQGWLATAHVLAVGIDLLPVFGATPTTTPTLDTAAPLTPTVATTLLATVATTEDRLNVRAGPGTAYAIVAKALPGEQYPVTARSADAAWLQIQRADGTAGWVAAAYVTLNGAVDDLPVATVVAAPASITPASVIPAASSGAAVSDLTGTLVIQTSPGGIFYVYDFATAALWPLTHGFDPALSPDGQTVAFVRDGGDLGLYLIDLDRTAQTGRNERRIFNGRELLAAPTWSPDGQWIAFTQGGAAGICYDTGRGCITPITPPGGGRAVVPEDATAQTLYQLTLARVDRDGNHYRDIAALDTARTPDWTTAGIVYASAAGLQITDDTPAATNRLVVYDYRKPSYVDPDWQADGGQIVYMGQEASHWEIFVINPDGSGQAALTRPSTTLVDEIPSNVAPVWSPDGQHIAFLSNRTDGGEAGAWRVWVMDADGSHAQPIPLDVPINYTYGGEQSLSWGQ